MTAANSEQYDDRILQLLKSPATQEAGFKLLLQVYQERLYRHLRQLLNSHNDADDVLQNTLIKIFRYHDQFKGDSQLYTWMYRIASNEASTFLKQKNRRSASSLDEPESLISKQLSSPSEALGGDDILRLLSLAIAELPEKQRLVFERRYYHETPYEELSAEFGTSVGALKASFHHAAKKVEDFILRMQDV